MSADVAPDLAPPSDESQGHADICPSTGQPGLWEQSAYLRPDPPGGHYWHLRCEECGWTRLELNLGLPGPLPQHRRADQCEIHGCWLSNGAGTPCDWCTEEAREESSGPVCRGCRGDAEDGYPDCEYPDYPGGCPHLTGTF